MKGSVFHDCRVIAMGRSITLYNIAFKLIKQIQINDKKGKLQKFTEEFSHIF